MFQTCFPLVAYQAVTGKTTEPMMINDNEVLAKMQLTSGIAQPRFITKNMHWLELSKSSRSHVIRRNLTTVSFLLLVFSGKSGSSSKLVVMVLDWVHFCNDKGSRFLFTLPPRPPNALLNTLDSSARLQIDHIFKAQLLPTVRVAWNWSQHVCKAVTSWWSGFPFHYLTLLWFLPEWHPGLCQNTRVHFC